MLQTVQESGARTKTIPKPSSKSKVVRAAWAQRRHLGRRRACHSIGNLIGAGTRGQQFMRDRDVTAGAVCPWMRRFFILRCPACKYIPLEIGIGIICIA